MRESLKIEVEQGSGLKRVVVGFDEGRRSAAFALLRSASAALEELDRAARGSDPPAEGR